MSYQQWRRPCVGQLNKVGAFGWHPSAVSQFLARTRLMNTVCQGVANF